MGMYGVLALDLGDAGSVAFPRSWLARGLGLRSRVRMGRGGSVAAASVPERRILSSMLLSVSGCCLLVFLCEFLIYE